MQGRAAPGLLRNMCKKTCAAHAVTCRRSSLAKGCCAAASLRVSGLRPPAQLQKYIHMLSMQPDGGGGCPLQACLGRGGEGAEAEAGPPLLRRPEAPAELPHHGPALAPGQPSAAGPGPRAQGRVQPRRNSSQRHHEQPGAPLTGKMPPSTLMDSQVRRHYGGIHPSSLMDSQVRLHQCSQSDGSNGMAAAAAAERRASALWTGSFCSNAGDASLRENGGALHCGDAYPLSCVQHTQQLTWRLDFTQTDYGEQDYVQQHAESQPCVSL